MLNELLNYTLLAFAVAALLSPFIISALYKFSLVITHKLSKDIDNSEFIKLHGHKTGTPRSGGLIIWLPVLILGLVFIPQSAIRDIWAITWTALGIYGFSDDVLASLRKASDRFRNLERTLMWRLGKLGVLYLIVTAAVVLFYNYTSFSTIDIFGFTKIVLEPWMLPVFSFLATLAIYGVEITDGLDGLVAGQFLIHLTLLIVLSSVAGATGMFPFLGLILGACMVYLYFNISPARVFMGSSGTMPVAFTMVMVAMLTNTVAYLFIAGAVYWVELASSFIQLASLRFFKRKLFRIAPIHHHFEAVGWPETKVVQRFWLACIFASIVALWLFVLVKMV